MVLVLCGQGDMRSGAQQLVEGCYSSSLQRVRWHKKTDFKGLRTFYQQEPGTPGLHPPHVQLSLVTVSSHVHLQTGFPPSERAVQWNKGCRRERQKSGEQLQDQWIEGEEERVHLY